MLDVAIAADCPDRLGTTTTRNWGVPGARDP